MSIIGLDIGSNIVKAVLLKEKGSKYHLTNYGIVQVAEENIDEADPREKMDLLANAIRRCIKESGIKTKETAVALSGDAVVIRYIKFPMMNRSELKTAIRNEADQYVPFNIEHATLDFSITGEVVEDGQKKNEIILVAAKEEPVNQVMELLKISGLTPAVIDVDVFALQNAYEVNYGKSEGRAVALINIGAKFTNLNIVEDGISRFTRDVPIGGNQFTKDIQREFNTSYIEAEKIKQEHAEIIIESEDMSITRIPNKEDKSIKIYSAIVPTLGKLMAEIRRSFDFYESQSHKRTINTVFLSGGGIRVKNIEKFFSERLKLPVEVLNPFMSIELDPRLPSDKLRQVASQLAVAVGLAVRKPA